ncbi:MAG: VanZ family protein [bacterium]
MPKFFKYYLPPILMAVMIFSFSSIPGNDYPRVEGNGFDSSDFVNPVAHMIEYFLLSFLILRAFDQNKKMSRRKKLILALFLTLLFALSDEYHQSFVPEREGSLTDWSIDALGVLAGLGWYMNKEKWRSGKKMP